MFIAAGLVRESGMIFKCFDEYVEGFTISDELRKVSCKKVLFLLKNCIISNSVLFILRSMPFL